MSTKESHIDRTSHEPRDPALHTFHITAINQISPSVRIFTLTSQSPTPITFLPGQWVDLYHPPFSPTQKPGGFTITSSPPLLFPDDGTTPFSSSSASSSSSSSPVQQMIELAIQSPPPPPPQETTSLPTSEATIYLTQTPIESLTDTPVKIRIGGSFTFPPPPPPPSSSPFTTNNIIQPPLDKTPKRILFVAGGMGINPLISMLAYIYQLHHQQNQHIPKMKVPEEVCLFYGVKDPGLPDRKGEVLFLERIAELMYNPPSQQQQQPQQKGAADAPAALKGSVKLFATGRTTGIGNGDEVEVEVDVGGANIPVLRRRMNLDDIREIVREGDKEETVVYICGPPKMTDEFVEGLMLPEPVGVGMGVERVFYEKWW